MPLFRVNLFSTNTNTRTGGWTENFWINTSSSAVALTRATDLAMALTAFRGYVPVFTKVRISQYGVRRSGRSYPLNIPNSLPANSTQYADYPTTKVQIEMTGADPMRTTQWLGGIQDSAITGGGFWTPNGAISGRLLAVTNLLTNGANGWSINVLNPLNTPKVITAFAATTGVVTTGDNHGFANNDFVRVMRINGITGVNGIWQITDATALTFRLIGWQSTTETMTRSNAVAVKQLHVPQQITAVRVVQATSHRVGKPAGLLGGRRRRPGSSLVGPLAHG